MTSKADKTYIDTLELLVVEGQWQVAEAHWYAERERGFRDYDLFPDTPPPFPWETP